MTEIISKPFDWNDNLSEIAQEDFSMIQKSLSYGTAQTIGTALAKLELLEKQGCRVEPQITEETELIKTYVHLGLTEEQAKHIIEISKKELDDEN